jgi:hypothetical protein
MRARGGWQLVQPVSSLADLTRRVVFHHAANQKTGSVSLYRLNPFLLAFSHPLPSVARSPRGILRPRDLEPRTISSSSHPYLSYVTLYDVLGRLFAFPLQCFVLSIHCSLNHFHVTVALSFVSRNKVCHRVPVLGGPPVHAVCNMCARYAHM